MKLQELLAAVRETHGIDLDASPFSAVIGRGLRISVFADDGDPAVITLSVSSGARAEYEALQALSKYIPDHVAAPLGMIVREDGTATIVSYVKHHLAAARDFLRPALMRQVGEVLSATARIGPGACGVNVPVDDRVISDFARELGLAQTYIDDVVGRALPGLARISQHGDFTLTNLGVTPAARLFVFDWEDHGRIQYPGFDAATFLSSLSHHLQEVAAIVQSPDRFLDWARARCGVELPEMCRIESGTFARLFPYYLAAFAYLKRESGYGREIFERTTGVIVRLRGSSGWAPLLEGRE